MFATMFVLSVLHVSGVSRYALTNPPTDRHVTVTVTISTTNGQPFPTGTPVTVSANRRAYNGLTDAEGRAVISGDFPSDTPGIAAYFEQGFLWITDSIENARLANAVAKAEKAFSLPPIRYVPLAEGQTEYSVKWTLRPSVSVSGRMVDAGGQPFNVKADREGRIDRTPESRPDGKIELTGIPKNSESLVFVSYAAQDGSWLWNRVVPLTVAQTASDVVLGDLTDAIPSFDGLLGLTCTGFASFPPAGETLLMPRAVTLLDPSGQHFFSLTVDKTTNKLHFSRAEIGGRVKMPSGTYYLAPGFPQENPDMVKAIRLLLAGRRADLDAAAIPKVTLQAGTPVDTTMDVWTVQAKLRALPSP